MGAKVCYRFYAALYTQLTYTIARMGVPSPVYASSNPLQSFNYNNLLKNFPEQKGQNILFHYTCLPCRLWDYRNFYCCFSMPVSNRMTYLIVLAPQLIFSPVNAYWDLSVKEKRCYNQKVAMMVVSALNSVSDLTVFLWPAPKIMDIQLPVKQRLGLVFVFSLGCM
jgi:hypothetical protein